MMLVIFLLAFLPWGLHATCPLNCSCPSLQSTVCSRSGLDKVPQDIDPNVEYLDLSCNKLHDISLPFDLTNLKFINISHNNIASTKLPNLPNLNTLDLSFNNLRDLHGLTKNLSKIQKIILSHNPIAELKSIASQTLEFLDLSHCSIKSLHNNSLKKLKELNLTGNGLTSLRGVSDSVVNLHAGENDLTTLDFNLPNLKMLNVSFNKNLVVKFTSGCLKLEKGFFEGCNLKEIILNGLCKVEELNLAGNRVEIITRATFSYNKDLRELNFSYNNLQRIDVGSFNKTKLTFLDLSNNELSDLSWAYLPKVQILNLSTNHFVDLNGLDVPLASILDFSHNELTSFDLKPMVTTLNLSYNLIEYLQALSSDNLKFLDLSFNQIKLIESKTFANLTRLEHLYLQGNKLNRLSPQVLVPTLFGVKLGNNPWNCDCRSPQFRGLMTYVLVNKSLITNPKELGCEGKNGTWLEECPVLRQKGLSESQILFVVGVFLLVALLGVAALVYCRSKKGMEEARSVGRRESTTYHVPVRRVHSEADVYNRPHQLNQPPPTYEEAMLLPPLSETERMTRSMGVLLDRTG